MAMRTEKQLAREIIAYLLTAEDRRPGILQSWVECTLVQHVRAVLAPQERLDILLDGVLLVLQEASENFKQRRKRSG